MCLREVEKSNVVVGLYGERYGWSISTEGDSSQNDLLRCYEEIPLINCVSRSFDIASKEFSWINELRDRSVTELELRMVSANIPSSYILGT